MRDLCLDSGGPSRNRGGTRGYDPPPSASRGSTPVAPPAPLTLPLRRLQGNSRQPVLAASGRFALAIRAGRDHWMRCGIAGGHPVRILAQHRHHIPLLLELGQHHGKPDRATTTVPRIPSDATRCGITPSAKTHAEARFCSLANTLGRPSRYNQRRSSAYQPMITPNPAIRVGRRRLSPITIRRAGRGTGLRWHRRPVRTPIRWRTWPRSR